MGLSTRRAFDRRRPSLRLMRPFGLVAGVGLVVVLVPPHHTSPLLLALAVGNFFVIMALMVASTRSTHHFATLGMAAGYMAFPFVALIREAGGGQISGLSSLLFLPMVWFAITGSKREIYVASVLACLAILVPTIFIGGSRYPVEGWKQAAVMLFLATVLGRVVQRIVERLERETLMAQSATERSERLFLDAPHGVAVLDDQGVIQVVNDALSAIVDIPPGELVGRKLTDLAPSGDLSIAVHLTRIVNDVAHLGLVDVEPITSNATDCVLRNARGQEVHVALNSRILLHHDVNEPDVILVSVVDVSERRRYQDRLAHLVDHDVLTGLANRRRFDSELKRHHERTRRSGTTGAVLLLDLDNFKQVNDSIGHSAGDQLLVTIGSLLRRSVRKTDVVARLGGDEFAVLLSDGDQATAEKVGKDIVERIRLHAASLDGVNRRVTASIGAVTFQAASEHSTDILALADMTMYDAKEAGRNQVAVLPEGEKRPRGFSARLQWQTRIEEALEHDRFELHLQPIMNLHNDRIDSAEVLLRLRDENDELVPPTRFVNIAERTGLMPQVDAWVVDHSLEILARLKQRNPRFELEVNLSGTSIGNPDIEQTIRDSLVRHQVDPGSLILEITETAAVADVALAREFAERMIELGCAFALDDFGAGFGSFYYLKHLLFDYVKIDGEFVAHVHESQVDRTIMRSIVGIAKDLNKRTVAEFVSDPRILEVCRDEGVDFAQGYWIGKPVPYDDFVDQFMLADVISLPSA